MVERMTQPRTGPLPGSVHEDRGVRAATLAKIQDKLATLPARFCLDDISLVPTRARRILLAWVAEGKVRMVRSVRPGKNGNAAAVYEVVK